MQTINDTFINALLADASYVDLQAGPLDGAINSRLLGDRVTAPQAAFLAASFEVASIANESDNLLVGGSGFDAIVWRGKANTPYVGQVYVSMRGTQPQDGGADLDADADLALSGVAHSQVRDTVNWWQRATTPAGQTAQQIAIQNRASSGKDFVFAASGAVGTGELVGGSTITAVNGHSLGGYLATAFTRLFGANVQSVSTYNAPTAFIGNHSSVNGGKGNDHLEGGADVLYGEDNDDTLMGGADGDIYRFAAGFGNNAIIDSDGAGSIVSCGRAALNGSEPERVLPTANGWQSDDQSDLIISINSTDASGTVTIPQTQCCNRGVQWA